MVAPAPEFELRPETSLAELELDSLGIMSMITQLECNFGIVMPAEALAKGLDTTLAELWTFCSAPASSDAG